MTISVQTNSFLAPNYFSNTTKNQLQINQNLIGPDATNFALNANYNAMNGQYQIPLTELNSDNSLNPVTSNAYDWKMRAMTFVNANMNTRDWQFQAYAEGPVKNIDFAIQPGSYSTFSEARIANPGEGVNSILFTQSLIYTGPGLVQEDTEINLLREFGVGSTTKVLLDAVSMFVTPTRYINPTSYTNQQAVDTLSVGPFKPLFSAPNNENASIAGIAKTIDYCKNSVVPSKAILGLFSPYQITSAGIWYQNSVLLANTTGFTGSSIMAYATANNVTQSSKYVDWFIYAGVANAAQPGRFEITSSVGGTAGITFANTTPTWLSGSILLATENLSVQSGFDPNTINGSTGSLTYKIRKTVDTSGTNVCIWSFQIFEGEH